MKILFYGETPCVETGAGRVNRYLLDTIVAGGYDVDVLGTSHFFGDDYDHERYPYPIECIEGDNSLETHKKAGERIKEKEGSYDVLFISADMHVPNILVELVRSHPTIVLAAIDGRVTYKAQVHSLEAARWPVVYSQYSYSQVLGVMPEIDDKFQYIPLGCEPDVFYPLDEQERRAYRAKAFGIKDDSLFLVMWANRNQMRKDPARAMAAFHKFHEREPHSLLYMHARMEDVGGNLPEMARFLGLNVAPPDPEVIFSPPDYTEVAGFDRDKLNKMYNAADVVISTSQGEGWGLTTTEAMAAGRPFIGPANTTFFEQLGEYEERGYLVECGGPDLWSVYYGHDNAPRPLTSVTDLAHTLHHVHAHREEAQEKAERAREWTQVHTWHHMKAQWKTLLETVDVELGLSA